MPAAKGRNRKERRAAAATATPAAKPAMAAEDGASAKLVGGTAPAGQEKQRRHKQREEQLQRKEMTERITGTVMTLGGKKGSSPKARKAEKKRKHHSGGAADAKKPKDSPAKAAVTAGDNVADLDADDFLSGGFMSLAGISDEEEKGKGTDGGKTDGTAAEESSEVGDDKGDRLVPIELPTRRRRVFRIVIMTGSVALCLLLRAIVLAWAVDKAIYVNNTWEVLALLGYWFILVALPSSIVLAYNRVAPLRTSSYGEDRAVSSLCLSRSVPEEEPLITGTTVAGNLEDSTFASRPSVHL